MSDVTLKFWIEDLGENLSRADEFVAVNFNFSDDASYNLEAAAEEYARDRYYNNDGWELKWPKVISVATLDGKFLGKVNVSVESNPEFSGKIIK